MSHFTNHRGGIAAFVLTRLLAACGTLFFSPHFILFYFTQLRSLRWSSQGVGLSTLRDGRIPAPCAHGSEGLLQRSHPATARPSLGRRQEAPGEGATSTWRSSVAVHRNSLLTRPCYLCFHEPPLLAGDFLTDVLAASPSPPTGAPPWSSSTPSRAESGQRHGDCRAYGPPLCVEALFPGRRLLQACECSLPLMQPTRDYACALFPQEDDLAADLKMTQKHLRRVLQYLEEDQIVMRGAATGRPLDTRWTVSIRPRGHRPMTPHSPSDAPRRHRQREVHRRQERGGGHREAAGRL